MPDSHRGAQTLQAIGPGRVNLLGEHVDYNDGLVLPAAIDRQVVLTAERVSEPVVDLTAQDLHTSVAFSLDRLDSKQDVNGNPLPTWALYPAGVAFTLQKHGLSVTGMRASYTSDIPIGSGLSSSAAVEVAFAALWQELGGWQLDRLTLAKLCQEAEVGYVGVYCGLIDQFACANGVAGQALVFDTRSLDWQPVPLPEQAAIIIADSTMRRSLSNSAYNERRAQCEEAVRRLRVFLPGIQSLRDVSVEDFNRYGDELPEVIRMRARHVVEEIARVAEAVPALRSGDVERFGQLMLAGHASLRDLYQVSIPELDLLVDLASRLPGCWGARLSGAGFGGCTVNLVNEQDAEAFIRGLKQGYLEATGKLAPVYQCRASDGVRVRVNR